MTNEMEGVVWKTYDNLNSEKVWSGTSVRAALAGCSNLLRQLSKCRSFLKTSGTERELWEDAMSGVNWVAFKNHALVLAEPILEPFLGYSGATNIVFKVLHMGHNPPQLLPPPQLRCFRSRQVTCHNSWGGHHPPPPFPGDIIDRLRRGCSLHIFRLSAFILNFVSMFIFQGPCRRVER